MQSRSCAYEGLCVTILININWTAFSKACMMFEVSVMGRFYKQEPVLYVVVYNVHTKVMFWPCACLFQAFCRQKASKSPAQGRNVTFVCALFTATSRTGSCF